MNGLPYTSGKSWAPNYVCYVHENISSQKSMICKHLYIYREAT